MAEAWHDGKLSLSCLVTAGTPLDVNNEMTCTQNSTDVENHTRGFSFLFSAPPAIVGDVVDVTVTLSTDVCKRERGEITLRLSFPVWENNTYVCV
jgi:hypothetical protein